MSKVISRDGTAIEYDRLGDGPPIILVLGACNDRATGAPLAQFLESEYTVINYDRRGRGESGDTSPYAIEREIEDIDALITEVGGSAFVFGYSSGAILALHAATKGLAISKLALYEPPYEGYDNWLVSQLTEFIDSGRRGDAVEFFQSKVVGIPEEVVTQLRYAPFRPYLEVIAHTMVYDTMLICEPPSHNELAKISAPTFIIVGGESSEKFRRANELLASVLPDVQYLCLEGQNHNIIPSVLAPVVKGFLASSKV